MQKLSLPGGRSVPARTPTAIVGIVIVIVLLPMLPSVLDGITIFWVSGMLISMLFAASYHLLLGTSGLLSFGHAAHFGIGAYITAICYREGWGLVPTLGLCLLVSLVAAIVIGLVTLRTSGVQFAILTLAFSMVAHQLTFLFREFTGGDDGISALSPPPLEILGTSIELTIPSEFFRVLAVIVIIGLTMLYLIDRSSLGHVLRSIRDDSIRSQYLGFRPRRYRMVAFALSGTSAGIAGALFVTLNGITTPTTLYWTTSSLPLIMVLIGGMRSFWGALIGAVVYEGLMYLTADVVKGVNIYLGLLVLLVVLFLPNGVVGLRPTLRSLLTRRPGEARERAKNPVPASQPDPGFELEGAHSGR
ncbi:branched-chain amino acid ABC transporter permease [Georgenia ruanii]|nr:branched-chain amino acid ABC transporter permease [Georgenia ruanii]